MGANIVSLIKDDKDAEIVCGVDPRGLKAEVPVYSSYSDVKEKVDVIIDFSSPAALKDELDWAVKTTCPQCLPRRATTRDSLR